MATMTTITKELKALSTKNLVDVPTVLAPQPPAFSNPINHKLYNSSLLTNLAVSSTDSLDTNSSSASTIKLTSTTSSPSLPNYFESSPQEQPTSLLPVPSPLLRKKSGELVKSSLKLSSLIPKAMSTSHLISNKSVRFASRLANIKMFDGLDSPSAVSSAQTTPLHSPPMPEGFSDNEDDEYDNDLDLDFSLQKLAVKLLKKKAPKRGDYFEWNWNGNFSSTTNSASASGLGFDGDLTSDTSSDEELNYWYSASSPNVNVSRPRKYRIDSCDVQNQRVQSNQPPVLLNSVKILEEKNQSFLYGLINCQNLAFEKHLVIKLTLNNWQTNLNFSHKIISYLKSFPQNNVDQFQFKIPLCDLIKVQNGCKSNDPFNSTIKVQMCVKYSANNKDYWDNNHNRNYHIVLKTCNSVRTYNYSKSTPALSSTQKNKLDVDDSFPQYDELVSKLINFKNTLDVSYGQDELKTRIDDYTLSSSSPSPGKSGLQSRYNINDELSHLPRTTIISPSKASVQAAARSIPARPPLMKQSYSASDVLARPTQKFSQSYKAKQQLSERAAHFKENLQFNSLSYTDLLANYCFSGGSTDTSPIKPPVASSVPTSPSKSYSTDENVFGVSFASSCSPASTFHSFSDSIHT